MSIDSGYAHPEILVTTQWMADHLRDDGIRIIESNEDVLLYDAGHVPGAVHIDWQRDLQDHTVRDYIGTEAFAALCRKHGIAPGTTCIFYGDKSNWWACYALWVFRLFGHTRVKVVDGGRDKWISEGRPLSREVPSYPVTDYPVPPARLDAEFRAFYDDVLTHSRSGKPLIDVRSAGEFNGLVTHMPEYPQEGVLRGGHIPGAISVPWKETVNPDATFKSVAELEKIYREGLGLKKEDDVIAYCRIGERSSHTWFVLHYLLGFSKVRNYDGSWTEWGNRVAAPIEKSG